MPRININNVLKAFLLMNLLMFAYSKDETCYASDNSDGPTVCPASLSPGTRAVCAGHALTRGKWTQSQFITTLHEIINSFPPENSYYSIGLEFADHITLKMAKINNMHADKELSLKLDPRSYYKPSTIQLSKSYAKPVLMYAASQELIDAATSITKYSLMPMGSNMRKRLVKVEEMDKTEEIPSEDGCLAWSSWIEVESLRHKKGAAILVPNKYWCPVMAAAHFDVVLGQYKLLNEIYYPEWEMSRDHAYGSTPIIDVDFQ
ncbi:putative capsid protein [Wuhan cricket virus]|uniref:putative capsid protein n=1 Tax=Wuhan cricket virus TaxID=1746070 RepID=UPI000706394F|nr:putative capsid protein [Wuhan cricket virus]ALL52920.1 putative capsid protein [Wuhan cricket virus]